MSRRRFTEEFKMAAVRRLEVGASVTEVARACEVDPKVLHRWRGSWTSTEPRPLPGRGSAEPRRAGSRSWSGRWADRRWRSFF
jgi:transposase-like protein